MKLCAKSRYALASLIRMSQAYSSKQCITLNSLAQGLKISKIYLEHIFSLLKRGNIVTSVKGAQGGYLLARNPSEITALDIIKIIETSLFGLNEATVQETAPEIETTLIKDIYTPLEDSIISALSNVTLEFLALKSLKYGQNTNLMYYL